METIWTPEQQKEHRKLWVEALRSGKYKQGEGALRKGDSFCCLGVACEVSGLGEWAGIGESGKREFLLADGNLEVNYLPRAVIDWLGVKDYNPKVSIGDERSPLALLNDQGSPFSAIANIIESEPPGLIANA